jgi:hypothetical protein
MFTFRPSTPTASHRFIPPLVRLDRAVDVVHKCERTVEPHEAEHNEERVGDHGHVAEVEGELQHAVHVGAVVEVVERVDEDEQTRSAAVDEGRPPPAVVLAGQLEVQQRDRDERGHHHQQDERDEQDAEEGVDLVAPNRREDVVQLDVDRREGQEASHEQLGERVPVPRGDLGNLAGYLVGAAGGLELLGGDVAAHDGAQNGEREVGEQNDTDDQLRNSQSNSITVVQ